MTSTVTLRVCLPRPWTAAWLAALLASSLVSPSAAQQVAHRKARLYRQLSRPGARAAEKLVAQAAFMQRAAEQAMSEPWTQACERTVSSAAPVDHAQSRVASMQALERLAEAALVRRARLDGAILRLRKAHALDRDNAEAHFALAVALSRWEQPGPLWQCGAERRDDEALAVFDGLQRAFPAYRVLQVAVEQAILHTRRHRFGAAQLAYRRAIALALGGPMTSTLHSNLAEVTMLGGDLEGALEHYAAALRLAKEPRDRALALWGGAVALDRLGEHSAALDHAGQALQAEGKRMASLALPGVFFEPAYERHYYEALGHEATARTAPNERRLHLEQALHAWQQFLRKAPSTDSFVLNARDNLHRIHAALERDDGPNALRNPRAIDR